MSASLSVLAAAGGGEAFETATPSGILGGVQTPVLVVCAAVLAAAAAFFVYAMYLKKRGLFFLRKGGGTMSAESPCVRIGNAHHIGARDSQQDAFGISDIGNHALCRKKGVFAVVADGMGGLSNGALVSTTAAKSLLGSFNSRPFHDDPAAELLYMLGRANDEVNAVLGHAGPGKSGSTVVAALIKDRRLYWFSVGDSRIALVRGGAIFQLNREHTYGSDLDERAAMGELSFEAAKNDPQRGAVTSYLGMGRLEKIDRNLRPLQLLKGDRLLLMTDGVFNTLTDEEILSAMAFAPHESAERLQKLVLHKNKPKQDNFTAIVLECM
ncbi:MAG TPA: PP2C family serine/threonine-protein phosphatase [Feifaniaceae bacterium]|nr:PP2C family serine/threonine-protein phosphatase [Feifaniaceae bacterium]